MRDQNARVGMRNRPRIFWLEPFRHIGLYRERYTPGHIVCRALCHNNKSKDCIHDAILALCMLYGPVSVCPSVTSRCSLKTAKHILGLEFSDAKRPW